jgi:hypothetical protein
VPALGVVERVRVRGARGCGLATERVELGRKLGHAALGARGRFGGGGEAGIGGRVRVGDLALRRRPRGVLRGFELGRALAQVLVGGLELRDPRFQASDGGARLRLGGGRVRRASVLELGTEARFRRARLGEGRFRRGDSILQHLALVRAPREGLGQPVPLGLELARARLQLAQVLGVLVGARPFLGGDVLRFGEPSVQALELGPCAVDGDLDRRGRGGGHARRRLDARRGRPDRLDRRRHGARGGEARSSDAHRDRARDALAHRDDAADELARRLLEHADLPLAERARRERHEDQAPDRRRAVVERDAGDRAHHRDVVDERWHVAVLGRALDQVDPSVEQAVERHVPGRGRAAAHAA